MPAKTFSPPLPHEHGAWAMFLVPLVIGIGVGISRAPFDGNPNALLPIALFVLVAFGVFLLRYPLMLSIKTGDAAARGAAYYWSGVYGAITLVGGVMLLIMTQLWWLALLGLLGSALLAIYLWLVVRRQEMSVVGEWTGIAGAALAAPGAYLVIARLFDTTALALFGLDVLFFGGTVYYIKFKVREQLKLVKPEARVFARLIAGRMPIIYSMTALVVVGLCVLLGWVPALVLTAFLLPLVKVIVGAFERPARPDFPRLGIIEVVYSVAFTIIIVLAFR